MATNETPFITNALERLKQERNNRNESELSSKKISADVTLKREQLRLVSSQEGNKFNPLPGTLSNFPKTDAAAQKGPTRFESVYAEVRNTFNNIPKWAIVLVIGVIAFFVIRRK